MTRLEDLYAYVARCRQLTGEPPTRIVLSEAEFGMLLLDARLPLDAGRYRRFMGIPLVIEGGGIPGA